MMSCMEKEAKIDFTEVPIDRMEMYDLLGAIYLKTCIRFEKVAIRQLIRKSGRPSICGKYDDIYRAMITSKLLLTEGRTSGTRYKWNMKKHGPVSLFVADMLIREATKEKRQRNNRHARSRYARGLHQNSRARKNEEK